MTQNRSSNVMHQRVEPHDSLDDFPTPPWAGRALCEHLQKQDTDPSDPYLLTQTLWEPACNRGALFHGLAPYFAISTGTDIFEYVQDGGPSHTVDFLWPGSDEMIGDVDWIITNPPFRLAEDFIERALDVAKVGCAMLLRTGFLHGGTRYERLFKHRPPTRVLHFAERVVMLKGRLVRAGATDWIGTRIAREKNPDAPLKKASTATDYSWFIWMHGVDPVRPAWVPPGSRLRLERDGDYDLWPTETPDNGEDHA